MRKTGEDKFGFLRKLFQKKHIWKGGQLGRQGVGGYVGVVVLGLVGWPTDDSRGFQIKKT